MAIALRAAACRAWARHTASIDACKEGCLDSSKEGDNSRVSGYRQRALGESMIAVTSSRICEIASRNGKLLDSEAAIYFAITCRYAVSSTVRSAPQLDLAGASGPNADGLLNA